MKFLLEFNQFEEENEESFELSSETIKYIKEDLHDFLSSEIEDVIPKIQTGIIFFDMDKIRIYCQNVEEDDEDVNINSVFIESGHHFTKEQLDILKTLISRISNKLICTSGHKGSLIITTKKLYDRVESIFRFPQSLEDSCARTDKWNNAVLLEFNGTNKCDTFLYITPYNNEGEDFKSSIELIFSPVIDHEGDGILFDVLYEVKHNRSFLNYNKGEVLNLKQIVKKIQNSEDTEVFMYDANSSADDIRNELSSWLEQKILPFFKNERLQKYEEFMEILKNLSKSGITVEIDNFQFDRRCVTNVKYKGTEKTFKISYFYKHNKVGIWSDEDPKNYSILPKGSLIKACPLNDFEDVITFLMKEDN